jgi:hypothetical protein
MKTHEGVEVQLHQLRASAALPPGSSLQYRCIEGWIGLTDDLTVMDQIMITPLLSTLVAESLCGLSYSGSHMYIYVVIVSFSNIQSC